MIDDNGNPDRHAQRQAGHHPGLAADREGVPYIDISGGFTIGNDSEGSLPQVGNTYSFTDNFSKVIGQHSLKFGGDFRIQRFDQTLYYNVNGYFSYSGGGQNDLEATDSTARELFSELSAWPCPTITRRDRHRRKTFAPMPSTCSPRTATRSNRTSP